MNILTHYTIFIDVKQTYSRKNKNKGVTSPVSESKGN